METVKQVLMERDQVAAEEADELIGQFKEELKAIIETGCLEEAEDLMMSFFGLEPDYLLDFLF